jgi:beta-phosphoglucomutase-like phosphatase (HAD superfamily)
VPARLRAVATGARPALLCDADGNLFPSEEPAFVASADVTNAFLASLGVDAAYTPEELRVATTGQNFRRTAVALAESHGHPLGGDGAFTPDELEAWVDRERIAVTEHLGQVLRPDRSVLEPLGRLARRYTLAAVSSSALGRLDACFRATQLDELIPPPLRFSAEDSLPAPVSKPDPAIYRLSLERLGVAAADAVAVEDSVPGVLSAVGAGIRAVGNVAFVGAAERPARRHALLHAGADAVVSSWAELAELLA